MFRLYDRGESLDLRWADEVFEEPVLHLGMLTPLTWRQRLGRAMKQLWARVISYLPGS